jgi:hypothetical protein
MSETPATHLARLKTQHPSWSIRHVSEGYGFTAHRGGEYVWDQTLPGLEAKLNAAGSGRSMTPAGSQDVPRPGPSAGPPLRPGHPQAGTGPGGLTGPLVKGR